MATMDDRHAKALEGILIQLTYIVTEMRKSNESSASITSERSEQASGQPMLVPLPDSYYIVVTDMSMMSDGNTSFTGKMYDPSDSQEHSVGGLIRVWD
jgi:hypothetical protein